LKRGRPRMLLTDNGAAMLAAETRAGLERLGIVHARTLAYAAYQKGYASHCTSCVGLRAKLWTRAALPHSFALVPQW